MLQQDLSPEQIPSELNKTEEINFIANLYDVPTWRVKQVIKTGVSLYEMETCFDLGAEL